MGETYNNVWGYTPNPYNTAYGAGGSSGGEGALLALRGSPLGVGTDIGGSIRMPAAICGIYGLKPAGGRFSSLGLKAGLPGQEAIKSVSGPMSADLDSLELYAKVILAAKPWERDPAVNTLPWQNVELPEKLAFGMCSETKTSSLLTAQESSSTTASSAPPPRSPASSSRPRRPSRPPATRWSSTSRTTAPRARPS
jgi:amidase